jgi:hypothetical protein
MTLANFLPASSGIHDLSFPTNPAGSTSSSFVPHRRNSYDLMHVICLKKNAEETDSVCSFSSHEPALCQFESISPWHASHGIT